MTFPWPYPFYVPWLFQKFHDFSMTVATLISFWHPCFYKPKPVARSKMWQSDLAIILDSIINSTRRSRPKDRRMADSGFIFNQNKFAIEMLWLLGSTLCYEASVLAPPIIVNKATWICKCCLWKVTWLSWCVMRQGDWGSSCCPCQLLAWILYDLGWHLAHLQGDQMVTDSGFNVY